MIKLISRFCLVLILFSLFACGEQGLKVERTNVRRFKSVEKDSNGKTYKRSAESDAQVVFKRIKRAKVSVFIESYASAPVVGMVDLKDFVEIVKETPGESYVKIKAFDKVKGFIEGYIKKSILFSSIYYSDSLELSKYEIDRLKEIAYSKNTRKLLREEKDKIKAKEARLRSVISKSREGIKQIMSMNYKSLKRYLKDFKEDAIYAENAEKTIKLDNNAKSLYISMDDGKVVGFKIINNDGMSIEEVDLVLYEIIGEFFYTTDSIKKINSDISKIKGVLKQTLLNIEVKEDKSKLNQYLELTVGGFTGIE